MKIEITRAQLEAIKNLTDDIDSMIGASPAENDAIWRKYVRLIDRMLSNNGEQRYFRVIENDGREG